MTSRALMGVCVVVLALTEGGCILNQKLKVGVEPRDVRSDIAVNDKPVGTFEGTPLETEVPVEGDTADVTVEAEPDPVSKFQRTTQQYSLTKQETPHTVILRLDEKTPVYIATSPPVRSEIRIGGELVGEYGGEVPFVYYVELFEDPIPMNIMVSPIDHPKYEETMREVRVEPGKRNEVNVNLEARQTVKLEIVPPIAAEVYIDGIKDGETKPGEPYVANVNVEGESQTFTFEVIPKDETSEYQKTTAEVSVKKVREPQHQLIALDKKIDLTIRLEPSLEAGLYFVGKDTPEVEEFFGRALPGEAFEGKIPLYQDARTGFLIARPIGDVRYIETQSDLITLARRGKNQFTLRLASPPVAEFTTTPEKEEIRGGIPVRLDASHSTDDGRIVDYDWTFERLTPAIEGKEKRSPLGGAKGKAVAHTFDREGKFTIRLTVTDDMGLQGTKEVEVFAKDDRPIAALDVFPGKLTEEGELLFFSARDSRIPLKLKGKAHMESIVLDFGDGSDPVSYAYDPVEQIIEHQVIRHQYDRAGDYTVKLMVTASNDLSRTIRKRIKVMRSLENVDLMGATIEQALDQLTPILPHVRGKNVIIYNLDNYETQSDDKLLSLIEDHLIVWLLQHDVNVLERDKEVIAKVLYDQDGEQSFQVEKRVELLPSGKPTLKIDQLKLGDFMEFSGDINIPIKQRKAVESTEEEHGVQIAEGLKESIELTAKKPIKVDLGSADYILGYRVLKSYIDSYKPQASDNAGPNDPDDITNWIVRKAKARYFFRLIDVGNNSDKPFKILWADYIDEKETRYAIPGMLRKVAPPREGAKYPFDWRQTQ